MGYYILMVFAYRDDKKPIKGRVYVLRITLQDSTVVHKIGMCFTPRSADRMMEILRSWFMAYRYIPETRLRLDYETDDPKGLESYIHGQLAEFKWVPDKKVDGHQEMFKGLDEEVVIDFIKTVRKEKLVWVPQ